MLNSATFKEWGKQITKYDQPSLLRQWFLLAVIMTIEVAGLLPSEHPLIANSAKRVAEVDRIMDDYIKVYTSANPMLKIAQLFAH